MSESRVEIESGVAALDGSAFTRVTVLRPDDLHAPTWQWTPEEARAFGRQCFEAAEAAEHDAAVFAMLVSGDATAAQAASFIQRLRDWRGRRPDRPPMSETALAYCPRCDLAFCVRHLAKHPDTAHVQRPTVALAAEYGATFCSVCEGRFQP